MNILAIITARSGSKGVPKKNIKFLDGIPLIVYSIKQAINSDCFSKIIVSTDDQEIADIAQNFGAEIPFIRPQELATDTASSIAVVQHAIAFFEDKNIFFDAVCLLQPTSPFREKGFIKAAITKFSQQSADALVSVLKVPDEFNPHWTFETDEKGFLKIATGENEIIKRRQDLPKTYFRDGSIYLTKVEFIKKGTFYGNHLFFIESNPMLYLNIDTPEDWQSAEERIQKIKHLL
jgi:N-acylneuraminate cytidylyltransferase